MMITLVGLIRRQKTEHELEAQFYTTENSFCFCCFVDRYCYNSTLAAFRMADPPQWQKACAMVARIKEEGMEPDLVSYSTAVQACLAASETGAAESLMNDMIQAGCVPVEDLKRVLLQRP